ncbi:oxidoreductase [Nocardia sp. NEAU-G5]|uniref:Oxidoreductase n=1 Tax=Nocardia albiluteola TaxID=2842303 RepID=A0ABS6AWG6_9NOCA|nr:oxidoreductase [Nocardia albiluteola]MBU3062243.1 oxidoreductase [Nocardia albiluteola]
MTDRTTGKTLFITGVSSGFGLAIARKAIHDGHLVVGTVRRDADAEQFRALHPRRAVARILDVTDDEAVLATVNDIESTVASIDVVIANAGYGHEGVFEESPLAELRNQFAVNVFGAVATIQAVLPHLRARRSGHILGITSMGGLMTVPGLAYYHGSKYALEGILETLGKEVAGFGIHVTAVAPGSFRTDWAGRSMIRTERSIPDYDALMDPVRAHRRAADGNQLGNPEKAAAAILSVTEAADPPAHLLLGSDALRLVRAGREAVDAEIEKWADLSCTTDFAEGAQLPG